jgi:phage RecT family recombinase
MREIQMAGRQGNSGGQTVRGAVEKRDGNGGGQTVATIEERFDYIRQDLVTQGTWFKRLLPSHVDAQQFMALCFNVIKESDWQLQQALVDAPRTFFSAANDCAMMGLVPGKTFHFVAFRTKVKSRNNDEPDRWQYQVTGMSDYKGEVELMYRSGLIKAVHCEVVRANDEFAWQPQQMAVPYHRIKAPSYAPEQIGLAGQEERGVLTGVYAYVELIGGGYSAPVVLGKSQVLKHRAVAKTEAFWGADWPEEGPWTPDMWRKTALHDLFDEVPHSPEYAANILKQQAAIAGGPREIPAAPEREQPALVGGPDHADRDEQRRSDDDLPEPPHDPQAQ